MKKKSKFELAMQKELSALSEEELKAEIRKDTNIAHYTDIPESLQLFAFKAGCHLKALKKLKLGKKIVDHLVMIEGDDIYFSQFLKTATKKQMIQALQYEHFAHEYLARQPEEIQMAVVSAIPSFYSYSSKTTAITQTMLKKVKGRIFVEIETTVNTRTVRNRIDNPPQELIQAIMMQDIIEK